MAPEMPNIEGFSDMFFWFLDQVLKDFAQFLAIPVHCVPSSGKNSPTNHPYYSIFKLFLSFTVNVRQTFNITCTFPYFLRDFNFYFMTQNSWLLFSLFIWILNGLSQCNNDCAGCITFHGDSVVTKVTHVIPTLRTYLLTHDQ